jgi:hypothetical protein
LCLEKEQNYYANSVYFISLQFLSSHSNGGTHINLYELTDDIPNNPKLNYFPIRVLPDYYLAPSANQLGNAKKLDVGDCRIKGSFYLNGQIHLVFSSNVEGWGAIQYFRISTSDLSYTKKVINQIGTDYVYPNIISASNTIDNKSSIIAFCSSSSSEYPSIKTVYVDDEFNVSTPVLIMADSYMNITGDPVHDNNIRWGDYTGVCRKNNGIFSSAWISGPVANFNNKRWDTWIAEIHNNHDCGPPANDECQNAESIQIEEDTCFFSKPFSNCGATNSGLTLSSSWCKQGIPDDDSWYLFSSTTDAKVTIKIGAGFDFDPVMDIHEGNCSFLLSCINNGSIGEDEFTTIDILKNKKYYIRIWDFNTGYGTSRSNLCVKKENISSIQDATLNDLMIFPNPTSGILNIKSESKINQIRLYNSIGKLLKLSNESNTLDLTELSTGVYIIKIDLKNKKVVQKLIKI